jgi:hypothetical protein
MWDLRNLACPVVPLSPLACSPRSAPHISNCSFCPTFALRLSLVVLRSAANSKSRVWPLREKAIDNSNRKLYQRNFENKDTLLFHSDTSFVFISLDQNAFSYFSRAIAEPRQYNRR